MPRAGIEVIVFDLGGVLVELGGMSAMLGWTESSPDEVWQRWLTSQTVRQFESGQMTAETFAQEIVRELDLPIDPDIFLTQFTSWPKGLYPGAADMLRALAPTFRLASMSNTNALHWQLMNEKMDLMHRFDANFPSHLTGNLKPDRHSFDYVAEQLACPPKRILFLDDNQINVDGATSAGLVAQRVSGVEGARAALRDLGLGPAG